MGNPFVNKDLSGKFVGAHLTYYSQGRSRKCESSVQTSNPSGSANQIFRGSSLSYILTRVNGHDRILCMTEDSKIHLPGAAHSFRLQHNYGLVNIIMGHHLRFKFSSLEGVGVLEAYIFSSWYSLSK